MSRPKASRRPVEEFLLLADNEVAHRFRGIPGDDYGRYLARCGLVVQGFALEPRELLDARLCGRCHRGQK